jgi:hypothetical protein
MANVVCRYCLRPTLPLNFPQATAAAHMLAACKVAEYFKLLVYFAPPITRTVGKNVCHPRMILSGIHALKSGFPITPSGMTDYLRSGE